jgi:hypothetical protein
VVATNACKRAEPSAASSAPGLPSAPNPKLVDRLAPGELAPGKSQVFGFEVPRDMDVKGVFLEVAYLEGPVSPESLANYVRERVEVDRVEIGAANTVFSHAKINRGAPDRVYDLIVSPVGTNATKLEIRDVTSPPPTGSGLSETERWRQAGRKPDGTPLDLRDFK